jgi:hypothetical protein
MNEHLDDLAGGSKHTEPSPVLYSVNGAFLYVYGEAVFLDSTGAGLVIMLGRDGDGDAVTATASVSDRKDLRLLIEQGERRPWTRFSFAAETFAVLPLSLSAGLLNNGLLATLAGMSDCPECRHLLAGEDDEAAEGGTSS